MNNENIKDFFLNSATIAYAGVSSDKKKFGRYAYEELKKKKFHLIPVHPTLKELDNEICYPQIEAIPTEVNAAIIMTPVSQTLEVLNSALKKGIRNIWIQQQSESEEVMQMVRKSDANIICKKCILMYAEPVSSFHKIHQLVWKFIGKY